MIGVFQILSFNLKHFFYKESDLLLILKSVVISF